KVVEERFREVRRSGLIPIKQAPGDELLSALCVENGDDSILVTAHGQSIRFKENDIREMGRGAGGVRGISLAKGDSVVGADVVRKTHNNPELLVMTESGFGKKTKLSEYKIQKRGGSGIKTVKVTGKTGALMVGKVVSDIEKEIVAISRKSQVIRIGLKDISTLGRSTQGVRIMKLRPGDAIASLVCLSDEACDV
ncbi:DNA gyrase subunit A, partial [bacterium]|nr:DNA gyrase subunit A [bacterium]